MKRMFLAAMMLATFVSGQNIVKFEIDTTGWAGYVYITGLDTAGSFDWGLGVNNDPTNAKVVMTVTSEGYNANGILGTKARLVYGVSAVRRPYPNNAKTDWAIVSGTPDTTKIRIAFSEYVYNDDKSGGAGTSGTNPAIVIAAGWYTESATPNNSFSGTVTNNSMLDYPKVIGNWAHPGWGLVSSTIPLEVVAFHKFGENAKPLAAMLLTAKDASGDSVNSTVTSMTASSENDANTVLVYGASLSTSTLTDGDTITCHFRGYPWVGDENSVLDTRGSAYTMPTPYYAPITYVLDKTNSYGVAYAVVDSSSGNDGTGVASATLATAEASPFRHIGAAITAIKNYNNNNFSRNNAAGGIVYLQEGNHKSVGATSTPNAFTDTWLTITKHPSAARANVVINDHNFTKTITNAECRIKFKEISIQASRTGGDYILWQTSADKTVFAFESCNITGDGNTGQNLPNWYHGSTSNAGYGYYIRNTVTNFRFGFSEYSTTKQVNTIFRGNTVTGANNYVAHQNFAVGNTITFGASSTNPFFRESVNNVPQFDNVVVAFNKIYNTKPATHSMQVAGAYNYTHGIAIVQNVFENTQTTSPVLAISADGTTTTVNNCLLWHNTIVGERLNIGYNDIGSGSYPQTNYSQKNNLIWHWNNKDDTFLTANANRTGSWAVGYNVGSSGNIVVGTDGFLGEFNGINSDFSATITYVDDNSGETGDASGSGDYHLQSGSDGYAGATFLLPFDIDGSYRGESGSMGSYEMGNFAPTHNNHSEKKSRYKGFGSGFKGGWRK